MNKLNNRVGERNYNKQGCLMEILEYNNTKDIVVGFVGYKYKTKSRYDHFKNGLIKNKDLKKENRLYKMNTNNQGCLMKIVNYIDSTNIIIEFQDEYKFKKHSNYDSFIKGSVKNPFFKNTYGVGFIGELDGMAYHHPAFKYWESMMSRCYNEKFKNNRKTYQNCAVCEEWHNFSNFAKWYDENYYEIDNETMCLDKDILIKGNKLYSPKTCVFVPQRINSLFTKCDKTRNCLIGTRKFKGKYISSFHFNGNTKHLGYYEKEIDAFNKYKEAKEKYIKQIADEYKDKIPQKLYEAMYKYKVETTD